MFHLGRSIRIIYIYICIQYDTLRIFSFHFRNAGVVDRLCITAFMFAGCCFLFGIFSSGVPRMPFLSDPSYFYLSASFSICFSTDSLISGTKTDRRTIKYQICKHVNILYSYFAYYFLLCVCVCGEID